MFNTHIPNVNELPSSAQLLRSTLFALVIAGVLLVTTVMPSEYAIDPTGIGRSLGLTQMGEVKLQLAAEAQATEVAIQGAATGVAVAQTATSTTTANERGAIPAAGESTQAIGKQHEINITLAPNEGAEVKLEMKEGAKVNYLWTANGGVVNYDTHGDPVNAPRGFYHGYGKGRATPEDSGVLAAAFDGKHGWFWRNRTDKQVTITLRTQGDYLSIKRVI
ncbi:transmembrane anchor protein [Escherichia coli]|uniref:transmembrane anchor protein n=1 Tax=Escherichia coli TaxID=562 RepID=UPI000BD29704|nr:transmembrane anchor protein [Escherichia coli]RIJ69944.1 transmembrane anchor protein [Escherichia coli]RIX50369.1 transmembrane anchor protein [Escherichia coli]